MVALSDGRRRGADKNRDGRRELGLTQHGEPPLLGPRVIAGLAIEATRPGIAPRSNAAMKTAIGDSAMNKQM
jgi:hypothetical protein